MENETLSNHRCSVSLNVKDKEITGRDLTDMHNEPKFYTTKTRDIKKAWAALKATFTEETTMYGAIGLMDGFNIGTRSYCAVD